MYHISNESLCYNMGLWRVATLGEATLDDVYESILRLTIGYQYIRWPPIPDYLIYMQVKKQQLEPDMEQWTGSKLGKEYVKAVYCHPTSLTFMKSTSYEMLGWMKHKLESRLPGEVSIPSDMQMIWPLWQKVKTTREPLDESEREEWKSWLKTQHSGGTLHPPSDVYVRSSLCPLPLFNKTSTQNLLSDQAWSLVPKLNLLQRSWIWYHSP